MNTLTNPVDEFVKQVRAELKDLTAEEIQSLTENLAEDLQERIDDEGAEFRLGDPVSYAAELRAAAGFAPSSRFDSAERSWLARWTLKLARSTWQSIKSVRPLWWVARAFVFYMIFASDWNTGTYRVFPDGTASFLFLGLLVVLSVQLGNGKLSWRWLKYPIIAINVVAIIGSTFWIARMNQIRQQYDDDVVMMNSEGLVWHGDWVNELKALDANGKVLPAATFLDQWGNKVFTAPTGDKAEDLNQIVGMTQVEAINWLMENKYDAVDFRYETVVGVKPDTVTGVSYNLSSNGSDYVVEVTVSTR